MARTTTAYASVALTEPDGGAENLEQVERVHYLSK